MKKPTRKAPHICRNVRWNTSPSCELFSLPIAASNTATTIQDARIALPPIYGANLNTAVTSAFAGLQSAAAAEQATAFALNQLTLGNGDHGPVQAATTIRSTAKGIQAWNTC